MHRAPALAGRCHRRTEGAIVRSKQASQKLAVQHPLLVGRDTADLGSIQRKSPGLTLPGLKGSPVMRPNQLRCLRASHLPIFCQSAGVQLSNQALKVRAVSLNQLSCKAPQVTSAIGRSSWQFSKAAAGRKAKQTYRSVPLRPFGTSGASHWLHRTSKAGSYSQVRDGVIT